jgi:cytochrome c biogenesis protein CcmG, thiol:disulfide interchange protein DsbE
MAQETPTPLLRRGPMPRLLLVSLALVAAAALIYVATRPLGGGQPQPSFFVIGSAGPGVQVGQIAPGTAQAGSQSLALIGPDGAPVSMADFKGRPIWVIFWKTACEPCEAEAADVSAAYAAHAGDRLAVIGIDVWDTSATVKDYLATHQIAIPVAVATTTAAMDAYGVWGAPTHYFIDRAGMIRDRYFGPMTRAVIDESLRQII